MREYFTITGYWKDTNENFDGYIVTNFDDVEEDSIYSEDDIWMFGFNESDLEQAVILGWDTIHDFVITEYTKIIQ